MPELKQHFEDHYRTLDGRRVFLFRFHCEAGSSMWRFAVKYTDAAITRDGSVFHDTGLVLNGETRDAVLDEAARWAECIHCFYVDKSMQSVNQATSIAEVAHVDG